MAAASCISFSYFWANSGSILTCSTAGKEKCQSDLYYSRITKPTNEPRSLHLQQPYLGRREGGHGDELEVGVTDQLPGQPEEGFLEVVVGLGGNVVVLKVLLSVENDGLGLDFAVLRNLKVILIRGC